LSLITIFINDCGQRVLTALYRQQSMNPFVLASLPTSNQFAWRVVELRTTLSQPGGMVIIQT
jgi:hypothetical protein